MLDFFHWIMFQQFSGTQWKLRKPDLFGCCGDDVAIARARDRHSVAVCVSFRGGCNFRGKFSARGSLQKS